MSIAKKVIARPVLTVIVFGLLAIISIYTLSNVAIDMFPEISFPTIMVQATYQGAGPESVEKSVTTILENGLTSLSHLKKITSTSSEGSCSIQLEFQYGTNIEAATNDIRDKLDKVVSALPDAVDRPSIFKFDASSMAIMQIAVRGNRTAEDLRQIADDNIKARLEQASGISQASVSGGRNKIVRVELAQNRLDAYGLTLTGVAGMLAAQNLELGGGSISEGTRNYLIRTTGEFNTISEIANSTVGAKNGYVVKLSDLGRIFSGFEDKTSVVYINGEPGVYISLFKQSGSNTVKAANAAYAKIEEVKKILPNDITLEIVSDDSVQVRDTINGLISAAYEGAFLAMLILLLFFRSIKSTIIMGISIPFSILLTLLTMHFTGLTLNMMTMTGLILGVGMIVDASIVILENIYQYRERGTKPTIAAALGSQEMMKAVFSGNITHVCIFIPIIFFTSQLGMIGQLFQDMIFTIAISLLASLVVALFLVPVLASRFLVISTRKEKPIKNKLLHDADITIGNGIKTMIAWYKSALHAALTHRRTTALIVLGMLLVSFVFIPRMNIALIPSFGDSSVTLDVALPVGTTLDQTEALLLQFQNYAQDEIKGVKSIITNVGTSGSMMSSSNVTYKGSLSIQLPDMQNRIDNSKTIQKKLRTHFDAYPNVKFNFSQGTQQQMLGGSDIDLSIRSEDLNAARSTAQEIVTLLGKKISGISEATTDMEGGLPQVEVIVDRDRAYSFGVNVTDAAREIEACIDGTTATVYRNAGKEYNVVVMFRQEDRSKVPDLERIYVNGKSGRVALVNFASLKKGVGPVSISREEQARVIHVTANIIGNVRADKVEAQIKAAMDESMILPEGVTVSFEGSWNSVIEYAIVFLLIITMAILLVFGVMAGTYESFKDPLINLMTMPLMIIGIVVIYLITGQTLTMFTAIGVVMLLGIVVSNGIILVDYTNLLVSRGVPLLQACLEGGASRLRPVLMTSLTTILGMIPMAFFGSENSQMIQPIGLTVIGGLASSTIVTLFFIPVVYSVVNQKHSKKGGVKCIAQK